MIIETQTYITNVTFSTSEAETFRNLADVIERTCHNRDDCNETCPFYYCQDSCEKSCGEIYDFIMGVCTYLTEGGK